ncbi:MAG: ribosome maturation factor RimP [Actinomycetota bacterium]|nr:ribosome maturation factor RimP [Actinomycetota bacterium]
MSVTDRVRDLIEPLVSAHGLELVDVEHGPGLLRIYLDREGGIDLETITRYSEQISDLLDLHDPVPSRYTLEVSSPGLERPLKTPAHFLRFVGTVVNIKTKSHVEGDRRFTGELTTADAEGVEVAGRRLAYDDIDKAKTVFEWGPTPKKTAQPQTKTKKATTP